jgi:DNA modification methylase
VEKAHQRRLGGLRNVVVENCHHEAHGKTRYIVARFTGIFGRTLDKITAIVDAANEQPARFGHLKDERDAEPRSVDRCFQKLKAMRQQAQERSALSKVRKPPWTITGDQSVVRCTLCIADPPYGITKEAWEPEDLETFTRDWSSRWAHCGADLLAIFWSQARLFDGRKWFDDSLAGYTFQQVLGWHANNAWSPKSRMRFKESWEPIFLCRRNGCQRQVLPNGKPWGDGLPNLDCCVARVPESNYSGEDLKQHPCQKPVAVMRWLIHALTEPGERVASPFCGVAPCGVATLQLGRMFHGIEVSAKYRRIAEARLAAYGTA